VYHHREDLWKLGVQLCYVLLVFPYSNYFDMKFIPSLASMICMIYGWKYTFLVDEVAHLFLAFVCLQEFLIIRTLTQVSFVEDEESKIGKID
jgi:hypothetical protein